MCDGSRRKLVILYGSETGTAQGVAERVYRESKRLHFETHLSTMDDYSPISRILEDRLVIFVASTTGQGDEPKNMEKFWKFLLRKNLPSDSLDALSFAVLGLGDSSYQKFNFVAKRLHKRLSQLGASSVVNLGLGDDQHDLGPDFVIDPWLADFWKVALEMMPLPEGLQPISPFITPPPKYAVTIHDKTPEILNKSTESAPVNDFHNETTPFLAPILGCQRVTSEDHFQDTRLVEFDISGSKITGYNPGDVCYVQPSNLEENVSTFFSLFPHLRPDMIISLEKNSDLDLPPTSILPPAFTLKECVTRLWDIQAIPGRYFFELMSHFSPRDDEGGVLEHDKLLELSTAEGQQELYDYCNRPRRNILEVLYDFRFTTPNIPLEYLFDLFPVIKPRAFSIASAHAADPNRIQLLVAVVNYRVKLLKAPRRGLCSNFLSRLREGDRVPIWTKAGTLKFPKEPSIPVVMVGPGTGVAPFRAYSWQQHTHKTDRDLVLFFGCRGRAKDFYFKDEWEKLPRVNFQPVFSREDPDDTVIYVQHQMAIQSKLVYEIIHQRGGWFYIAGNAKQMPDAVTDALKEALRKHGGFENDEEVEAYVANMEAAKRFQTETWS